MLAKTWKWANGRFHPSEAIRYTAAKAALFWLLIGLCWLIYPAENQFSIMSHTFSFLGSPAEKHNPNGWWLFTAAMVLWGLLQLPLVRYSHRRLRPISPWGARAASLCMAAGCVALAMVGIFPDIHGTVFGPWEWRHIHTQAAIAVFVGFALGIGGYGLLLVADAWRARRGRNAALHGHRAFAGPYALWIGTVTVAGYFLGSWEVKYARMKAEAEALGQPIGSSWSEALHTRYAFPLWENLVIYALFAFLAWFMVLLARRDPA